MYVGTVTGTKAGKLTSLPAGQYLIIATAKDGYAFNQVPTGWKASPSKDADGNVVKVSRVVEVGATDCEAAAISVTTTAQTCSATGTSVPGSLTLDKLNIGSAYVYVGRKTGTKAPDLSSTAPGDYLVIASASSGHWFHSVPPGWKASPTKDAAGHTVKLSTIVTVNPTTCGT